MKFKFPILIAVGLAFAAPVFSQTPPPAPAPQQPDAPPIIPKVKVKTNKFRLPPPPFSIKKGKIKLNAPGTPPPPPVEIKPANAPAPPANPPKPAQK